MKTLNESFTDQEFEELKQAKDATGLNWHDFLMSKTVVTYHCWNCDWDTRLLLSQTGNAKVVREVSKGMYEEVKE